MEPTPNPTPTAAAICQEDDPCWSCATMGNLICGPTAVVTLDPAAAIALPDTAAPYPGPGPDITGLIVLAALALTALASRLRGDR